MLARNTARKGTHYTLFESGALKDWINNSVDIPGLGKVPGKLFLKDAMGLSSTEISINAMPPGQGMPFHHTHRQNEEVYIFIHGKGQVQVDGETLDVREGSVVRIAPKGERVWRNNGSEMLVYIVMQMREGSLQQWGTGDADIPQKPVVWPA
ncbi:cupin domain-containing protein [Thiocapsa sp.]|uniref:cupin domain-containing protein n=1 Tax=Thiocapsa sp. TaxID=2024551 RepID=UPI003593EB76